MHPALIAACCALAGLQAPLAQDWSDAGLITADDDWSGVPAITGHRGDGFELANRVVALRGSATASARQLVMSSDTRGRKDVTVRMTLRDIGPAAVAVEPVALRFRAGGAGDFANVPGGYIADATSAAPPAQGGAPGTRCRAPRRRGGRRGVQRVRRRARDRGAGSPPRCRR